MSARENAVYCTACYCFFVPTRTLPVKCPHCDYVDTLGLTEMATVVEVRKTVARIEDDGFDAPGKHIQEDCLYVSVLRAIASGKTPQARELAQEALRVAALDFDRWYE